jgi:diguanylate cyclase (GGDEF)-like protein
MDLKPQSTIPTKTALMLRFTVILAVCCGIVEILEAIVEKYISTSELVFEFIEFGIMLGLLLIFAFRFVVRPLFQEITLRKQSEQKLEQSGLIHMNIIEALPDAVLRVTSDGTVIEYIPKQGSIINFKTGSRVDDVLPPDTITSFFNCMNTALRNGTNQKADILFSQEQEAYYLVFNFVKTTENEVTIFIRDITSRKVYEERLKHLSSHDVLTGLYNRTFYESELERLATSRRYPVGIIVIDMDKLKATNDTYGHSAGDRMICKAADILKSSVRIDDMLARTGGDEFTVLLPETGSEALLSAVERIEQNVNTANNADDGFIVKVSMGTAIAETKEKLLGAVKIADMKMYQNKISRKSKEM